MLTTDTTAPKALGRLNRQDSFGGDREMGDDHRRVAAQVNTLYDPWGRSLFLTLRRWWILPVVCAVLAAIAGLVIGSMAMPSARSTVRVQSAAMDGQGMQRTVETAVKVLESSAVFEDAADETGAVSTELRRRTEIAPAVDSMVIEIVVSAPTEEQALDEADAVADAGVRIVAERLDDEVARMSEETKKLIEDGELDNDNAERSRVARLGDALADSQSLVVSGSDRLDKLEDAVSTTTVSSAPLLAVMGLIGGGLTGAAAALLIGGRRGKVRSGADLRRLYPHVPVIATDELPEILRIEAASRSTFLIGGFGTVADLEPVATSVVSHLSDTGEDVRIVDTAAVMRAREARRQAPDGVISVVPTRLNGAVMRAVDRDDDTVLIIVVQERRTRIEQIDQFAARLGDTSYLVVCEPPAPAWA